MNHKKGQFVIPFLSADSLRACGNKPLPSVFEFHIAEEVRRKYDFDETLFSFNGNVVFANFQAVRRFVQKMNEKRAPELSVRVGQVNAMGLLDEIYHFLLRHYEMQVNPEVFTRALSFLKTNIGNEYVHKVLLGFTTLFPPVEVYRRNMRIEDYLAGSTDGRPHEEIALEEMMLLHFANFNPANKKLKELFDDTHLVESTAYNGMLSNLEDFFRSEKPFGPDNQYIFDLLRAPILSNPDSIEDQLKFVLQRWSVILDEKYANRILSGMDLIKEDKRLSTWGGGGGAPSVVPKYKSRIDESDIISIGKSGYNYGLQSHLDYVEPERFTQDIHWMPQVVLLAKNIYVWLDQLSRKYNRTINRLDLIPDEELDNLQRFNFTGLWLIGLWERSKASQKIKQMTGNPEAVPSAYSLYDYVISEDLGGEEAFQNLNERARRRGIRLASDMVPNHMGIYSKWVLENPHFFIQSQHPPFPNYRFTGPDLSDDPNVSIRIEDGYWSKTDAAVVFQRIDNRTGDVRYIYHGNDGTNMPWNDTAQLDMLKAEVREAVIQTIFHVARKTSIIRFDAAMTLAKRHFHRLWYPQPGTGGDIPSRADYGLPKEEFDSLFPVEFWREVVDRFNESMPDTLLLAEAFWLMEGYFVRTLGMHRVYNSAFMHMMMKEENAKYRDVITNTLEFNPEILKRYVNFMSNPDEETAIKQFGTDDKYFGVCTLLVTMPGLPMFGHGQIEGFTEKYGMEYKRAYYNEIPNQGLIDRHVREIFPLMKKRYIFSQVSDFWFYDFIDNYGHVNENVFAYSNGYHDEKAVVIYNNKFAETSGWINHSTGKSYGGDEKNLSYTTLANALGINPADNHYYMYRDHITGMEFIRTGRELHEKGMYFELKPFKYHVFLDFREVYSDTGEYENLYNLLSGSGVPSIAETLMAMKLASVHDALLNLFDNKVFDTLNAIYAREWTAEEIDESIKFITNRYYYLLNEISGRIESKTDLKHIADKFKGGILALRNLNKLIADKNFTLDTEVLTGEFLRSVYLSRESNYNINILFYLLYLTVWNLGKFNSEDTRQNNSLKVFNDLHLYKPIHQILQRLGRSEYDVQQAIKLIIVLIKYNIISASIVKPVSEEEVESSNKERLPSTEPAGKLDREVISMLERLLADNDVKQYLNVNYYQGEWYYSKENLEDLINWILTMRLVGYFGHNDNPSVDDPKSMNFIREVFHTNQYLKYISDYSSYKMSILFENIVSHKEDNQKDKPAVPSKLDSDEKQESGIVPEKGKGEL